MNTYSKYIPNVFLAKCTERHEKGETITVSTKYGKENESIVYNLIAEKDDFFYYSIIRADGLNAQTYAEKKADKLKSQALNATKKSTEKWEASNKDSGFLSLGEPIKVGHHSERRHRKIIEQANNNMARSVEYTKKAETLESRAEYWEARTNTINLSMPESLEFYRFKLEQAETKHKGMKDGTIPRSHSYSLSYAKKEVKELTKKVDLAVKLWGGIAKIEPEPEPEAENIEALTLDQVAEMHGHDQAWKMLEATILQSMIPTVCPLGCESEPDGSCEHGFNSVLLVAGLI